MTTMGCAGSKDTEPQGASTDVIVVGGGTSAGYFCRGLADNSFAGSVTVIGGEPYLPYERPALTKGYLIKGGFPVGNFATCAGRGLDKQDGAWYTKHNVDFRTSTKVASVDAKAKSVTLADGTVITATTALVVSTGARATTLDDFKTPTNHVKSGLFYLRDVADTDAVIAALKAKGPDARVVLVGGGYIGMETAACLTAHSPKSITMVFPEDCLMARAFNADLAAFYEARYAAEGVTIMKKELVTSLNVDDATGALTSVGLKSGGTVEGDIFIVGVGGRPNTELVAGQLDTLANAPGGIVVDGQMRASAPGVFAIGDIAAYPCTMYGGEVSRFEHVHSARETAFTAAAAVAGAAAAAPLDYLPHFYSRILDLSWVIYGKCEGEVHTYGDMSVRDGAKFGAWWVQSGKVVGGFLEGASDDEVAELKKIAVDRPAWPLSNDILSKIGSW